MLRTDSSWIKNYKVGKETRISIGVNSAKHGSMVDEHLSMLSELMVQL